jgi:three-Cys-motif partner protein
MSNKAKWNFEDEEIPSIEPHTKIKHLILEQYIENLIYVMHGKTQYGIKSFTLVDGFCGGGQYRDEQNRFLPGSPIRIIEAVRRGFEKSKRKYSQPLDIQYVFIDSSHNHIDFLKKSAMLCFGLGELVDTEKHIYKNQEHGQLIEQCEFICGEFENVINSVFIKLDIRKGHSLFFLDPFGYTDVSMSTFRKIHDLPKSEVIYTYMIDFIRRFLSERNGSLSNSFNKILEAQGYYTRADLENTSVGQQCYLKDETLRLFRDKGFEQRSNQNPLIFTFSLIPKGQTIVMYYLVHMSRNIKALEVIKECFQSTNNLDCQYHYEIYGYGHRTLDFYNENYNAIQLNTADPHSFESSIMEKLESQVGSLILDGSSDGITFASVKQKTMELNPASPKMYMKYIYQCQQEHEIEVIRKDKLFTGLNLQNGDFIRRRKNKQLSIFKII